MKVPEAYAAAFYMETAKLPEEPVLHVGPFVLDRRTRTLTKEGGFVHITPREYQLLLLFLESQGMVVSAEQITARLWDNVSVVENNVAKQVSNLRRKLGTRRDGLPYIRSIAREGYLFPILENPHAYPAETGKETVGTSIRWERWGKRTLIFFIGALTLAIAFAMLLSSWRKSARVFSRTRLTNNGFQKAGPILVSGDRLYFRQGRPPKIETAYVPIGGGEPRRFDTGLQDAVVLDGQEDGRMLVRSGAREIWIRNPATRDLAKYLTFGFDVSGARFSPDGSLIAFTTGHGVVVTDTQTAKIRYESSRASGAASLCWFPDGRNILFQSFDLQEGFDSLWRISFNPDQQERILSRETISTRDLDGFETTGWLTADSLIFEANRRSHRGLWRLSPIERSAVGPLRSASHLTQIPNCESAGATVYGKSIYAICAEDRGQLESFDWQSRHWEPVTGSADAYEISFSPNRAKMAFTRSSDNTIWISATDGSMPVQVSRAGLESHFPHWSPNGSELAYMGYTTPNLAQIYLLDVVDGIPRVIGLPGEQGVPNWSSDGKTILWGELRRGQSNMQLHAFGFRPRNVSIVPGTNNLWSPRWAPDGSTLLALTSDSKSILVADTSTADAIRDWTSWKKIAEFYNIVCAEWSPDSKSILALVWKAGSTREYLLGLDRGTGRELWSIDMSGFDWFSEPWIGSTLDGRPLALTRARGEELFRIAEEDGP